MPSRKIGAQAKGNGLFSGNPPEAPPVDRKRELDIEDLEAKVRARRIANATREGVLVGAADAAAAAAAALGGVLDAMTAELDDLAQQLGCGVGERRRILGDWMVRHCARLEESYREH
jgi:hypothetical protein